MERVNEIIDERKKIESELEDERKKMEIGGGQ